MMRAGEAGSGIAAAVRRAADFMEAAAATQRAIRGALAYPILLAAAGAASVALLIGIVLPRFEAILIDLGHALPTVTRIVLTAAAGMRAGALPALLAVIVIAILGRTWVGTETGLTQWHRVLLSLPVVGPIRRSAATARVSSALAALLESGVPIAPALLHAARAGGDAALTADIVSARESVLEGSTLARAFEARGTLTPTAVRLVRAGEETGQVGTMLTHIAKLEGERAEQAVKSAVGLLEPGLIIAFGGIVAVVAAALLQAVYSVRPGS
jgi:type II secretory pathway component PulF